MEAKIVVIPVFGVKAASVKCFKTAITGKTRVANPTIGKKNTNPTKAKVERSNPYNVAP